jgi:hypothetical protein
MKVSWTWNSYPGFLQQVSPRKKNQMTNEEKRPLRPGMSHSVADPRILKNYVVSAWQKMNSSKGFTT